MLKGLIHMNMFSEAEFAGLCGKLPSEKSISDITVRYASPSYYNRLKGAVQWDRRGEVVFCVIRPNGKIITTTCGDYPKGIYRIPTGGIKHNEDIMKALFREVKEELGLEVKVRAFGGAVRIRFEYDDDYLMFYSYLFILDEIGGKLLLDASDNEISEIREVDLEGLSKTAGALGAIKGKWRDWGHFRYITTNAVYQYLKKQCI